MYPFQRILPVGNIIANNDHLQVLHNKVNLLISFKKRILSTLDEPPPCDFTVTDFAQTVLTLSVNHGGFASRLRFLAPDWVQQLRRADPETWQYLALIRIQVNGYVNNDWLPIHHLTDAAPKNAIQRDMLLASQQQSSNSTTNLPRAPIDRSILATHSYVNRQQFDTPIERFKRSERCTQNRQLIYSTTPGMLNRSFHKQSASSRFSETVTDESVTKEMSTREMAVTEKGQNSAAASRIDRSFFSAITSPNPPTHSRHTPSNQAFSLPTKQAVTKPQDRKSYARKRENPTQNVACAKVSEHIKSLRRIIHTAVPGTFKTESHNT